MARNIEIKARIDSVDAVHAAVTAMADQAPLEFFQDDTFFLCPTGRLKLRTVSQTEGELIFYQRPDMAGPKESFYVIAPITAPDALREVLSLTYGQCGRVRKHRTLFWVGRTRIHLDRVEELGHFLELEVVLADEEIPETSMAVAQELLDKLGVTQEQLIAGAYVDLLCQKLASGSSLTG